MSEPKGIDRVGFEKPLTLWADACFPCPVVEGREMLRGACLRAGCDARRHGSSCCQWRTHTKLPSDAKWKRKEHRDEQNAQC